MAKGLSEASLAQFHRDGYVPAFPVLDDDTVAANRAKLEAYEAAHGPLHGAVRFKSHLLFKWLSDLVRAPRVLDAVEDVIGPDILLWSTDWFIKEAHSPSFVSWHQDSQYWGLDTNRLVTVWVALSSATRESGCMRVLPGSHKGPELEHVETYHEHNLLTRGQTIGGVDESAARDLEVPAGHATLFAFRIAHASHPNRSDDRRIAMAMRYIPPDARQVRSDADTATLVRGVDRFGYFEHEPEPCEDFNPVSVAFHERAAEERRRILYHGTGRTEFRT